MRELGKFGNYKLYGERGTHRDNDMKREMSKRDVRNAIRVALAKGRNANRMQEPGYIMTMAWKVWREWTAKETEGLQVHFGSCLEMAWKVAKALHGYKVTVQDAKKDGKRLGGNPRRAMKLAIHNRRQEKFGIVVAR